ncbi:MAG: M20/M25/M40 family metallo-hydrolase [Candidatus Aminicenantes bacterium]|nr:M20/M25/M40 family metallo-hydrolase [Candidatus Aminicenantes bacterium]
MKFRNKISLALTAALLFSLVGAQEADKNLSSGLEFINPEDAYSYVKTLSSPEFEGRHTGHPGYTAAAKWAAKKFKEWGLRPIIDDSCLQPFDSPYTIVDSAEMTLYKKEADKGTKLQAERDFLPLLSSDSGDHTARVVFAGWGISAPELGYDDYAGLEVEGKFVLCFRGTPDRSDKRFQKHDEHRHRMQTAKDKGALGIFYIYPEPIANPNMDWIQGFTPTVISEKTADMMLEEKGVPSKELKKDLLTYQKPISFSLSSKVHYKVTSRHFPDAEGYNIAAYVEGSDPDLKKHCMVYGAHFDHCGKHMGLLFAGADDNASGSAVVMEIAQAFSQLKTKPKRSVVFVLFGAEEKGLQGSHFFADHIPPVFEKVDGMFNFDMVGEGDGTSCSMTPDPEQLHTIIQQADESIGILGRTRFFRGVGVRGSDYVPFYKKGIPCASFASNGPHIDYHGTGDTIYRINPDIMADIAKLAFIAGYNWANR